MILKNQVAAMDSNEIPYKFFTGQWHSGLNWG